MVDNTNAETNVYPKLIKNMPCAEDLFAGKAHTTIAANICDTIKNNPDCRMIGLDGSWGSGKSNLLKIVEKQLNQQESEKYHFFLYDAWGHQEDIQRRAILENLTEFLVKDKTNKKVDHPKDWEKRLSELLSKTKVVESKTIPKFSGGMVIALLTIIFPPIITSILKVLKVNTENITTYTYIVFAMLLVLFFIYKVCKTRSIKEAFSALFSFYTKDRNDIISYESISESIPDSRKFKKWIKDISETLCDNNNLIIIFDNMDRLPSDKVQELWSSIHSFFAEERYEHIWVIVPFDRMHIRNAFKKEDIQIPKTEKENASADKYICYGDDFINKTFDVVYRVSPPIMSDWKGYFRMQWHEAFGNIIDQNNYENVMQIYDMLTIEQSPRKIIAFINEIVTIKQIVKDTIPYQYIALYIFGKQSITEKGIIEIFSPTFLGAIEFLYKNDSDLAKYLAALYYQLPPEQVESVIFKEKLKQSLDNKDINTVKEISKSSLFIDVLESAVPLVTSIGNAVEVISDIFDDKTNNPYVKHIWRVLYNKARGKAEIKLENYQYILLKHIETPLQYLKAIVDTLANDKNFNPKQYYSDIKKISELKNIDVFSYLTSKKLSIEQFIAFINLAESKINSYRISCDNNELDTYLSELEIEKLKEVTFIPHIVENYTFKKYKSKLIDSIKSNQSNKEYIEILYTRLKELERHVPQGLLSDSNIYSLFTGWDTKNDFYYDLICMRIARFDQFSYQSYFENIFKSTDDNTTAKISERIEYYTTYGDILINLSEMNFPLYKCVAQKLTENHYGISTADIEEILNKYDVISKKLGLAHEVLISRLNGWSEYAIKDITISNITNIPVEFFKAVSTEDINNKLTQHCMNILDEYFKNLTKEQWIEEIKTESFAYQTIEYSTLPHYAVEALEEVIKNYVKVEAVFTNCTSQITYLIEKAEKDRHSLQSIAKNIRDIFTRGDVEMTKDLFSIIGVLLLKQGKLELKTESLRTIFPNIVVDSHIDLLLQYGKLIKRVVQKAEAEDVQAFSSHLINMADKNEKARKLINILEISQPEQKENIES